jgi:sugar phosphate permease
VILIAGHRFKPHHEGKLSLMDVQTRTLRKVATRLIPALLVLYVIAYLDRVNVTFAQDKLEDDLGFSGAVYGLGAGIFFIGYFLLEIPSNLAAPVSGRPGSRAS